MTKFVIAVLTLASALMTACSSAPAPAPSNDAQALRTPAPAPSAKDSLSAGREIFVANCAVCHGANGEGQPNWQVRKGDGTLPPPPLNGDGHTWHHADGLLYRIVSQGGKMFESPNYPSFKSAMPAFGDSLNRQEIIATLTYVKSLWGDKTRMGLSIRESQALVSADDPFPK